jgi:hypothetical protein
LNETNFQFTKYWYVCGTCLWYCCLKVLSNTNTPETLLMYWNIECIIEYICYLVNDLRLSFQILP